MKTNLLNTPRLFISLLCMILMTIRHRPFGTNRSSQGLILSKRFHLVIESLISGRVYPLGTAIRVPCHTIIKTSARWTPLRVYNSDPTFEEFEMPKAKGKKTIAKRILWTRQDVRLLRQSARKQRVAKIARALRRSEAAVRYKASILKISLAVR